MIRNRPGHKQRNNILTCYTPLPQADRAELLSEDRCRKLAAKVLTDFCKLFPKMDASPVEVQLYRRGHPMMISTPGNYTELLPLARRPMERVFFANTDSQAAVSAPTVPSPQRTAQWTRCINCSRAAMLAKPSQRRSSSPAKFLSLRD